jgi:hypothetical protein
MHRIFFAAAAVSALLVAVPAAAQQVVPVTFAKGKSSATLTGSIKGDQDRTYTVDAKAGQKMTVTLKSTKGSAEMNIFAPGNDTAISLGATDPYNVTTVLPATGRYRVQVFQMRAAARRGETANYTLTIGITGAAGAAKPAPVKLDDLQGARAAGALDEMERRGFRNVDGFQSGANGSGTVWWNGATRQCMQLITVDGRIDSVTDIKTHPKCR